jgi:hypothetical protein
MSSLVSGVGHVISVGHHDDESVEHHNDASVEHHNDDESVEHHDDGSVEHHDDESVEHHTFYLLRMGPSSYHETQMGNPIFPSTKKMG